MAYEHLQPLTQHLREVWIYSLLTGLEVHETNSVLFCQILSAMQSYNSYSWHRKPWSLLNFSPNSSHATEKNEGLLMGLLLQL